MMKQIKLLPLLLLSFLCLTALQAQTDNNSTAEKWQLGIGLNLIEDNGMKANTGSSTHFSNPFSLSADYALNDQWAISGSLSFNKYKAGKTVDGVILTDDSAANYMAFDLATKFYFSKILNSARIEPYLQAGIGYTNIGSYQASAANATEIKEIPQVGRMTLNAGFGANYWFADSFGLNLNLMGKFGVKSGENKAYISNQMQFSFGFIYSKSARNWRS